MSVRTICWQTPNEILKRTARLRVDDGDTIQSATWEATPAGLTITPGVISQTDASALISGGTAGITYTLTIHAIGTSGQRYDQSISLKVAQRQLTEFFPMDPSDILDFKATLELDPTDTDTVASATWTVSPAGPVVVSTSFTSTTATARIDANSSAVGRYIATVLMVGTSGQRYEQSILIKISQQ